MAKISIELDVLNCAEIVSKKKGAILGSLASLSLSEKRLKRKVEQEICKEIVNKLRENLDQVFKDEGITAHLRITSKA